MALAVAALSGGVDSSLAAALLLQEGRQVSAVTLRLYDGDPAKEAIADAARAARALDVPHQVLDLRDRFREVIIDDFLCAYQAGRTPNPCVRCNRRVKFAAIYEQARRLGAGLVATGHYARRGLRGGRWSLRRDPRNRKDQTYALAALSQEQLRNARFPVAQYGKEETRALAARLGLPAAERPESQDICFIPSGGYRDFIARHAGPPAPGPIVDAAGNVLGAHRGLTHYTVGQRKGLGISAPEPYYVLSLEPARNALVVGRAADRACAGLVAADVHWMGLAPQRAPFRCHAQIRYRQEPQPALASPTEDGIRVDFDEPVHAVAPGQWVVLYDEAGWLLASAVIEGPAGGE